MSHELFYTSAPRGLRPGEHGFCTVAVTQGISQTIAAKVESLSGYRHLYPPTDRRASLNPVLHAHLRLSIEGKSFSLLSRIGDAGLDYSQRTNKFAHHVLLDRSELPPAGPAWLLQQPGFMESEWGDRSPQILSAGRPVPQGEVRPARCRLWEQATGDAGWAGVLATMTTPTRPAYLVFRPGQDPLPLIAEALALLPAAQRWNITFSTYFLGLPPDVPCQWRCIVAGTPETSAILESPNANVIMLDSDQGRAPDGPLVEAARTGRVVPEQAAATRQSRGAIPVAVGVSAPESAAPSRPPIDLPHDVSLEPPMDAIDPPPPGSPSSGVMTLALGLLLGLVLMFMGILVVELVAGRSLPGFAGFASKGEEELQKQVENLKGDLNESKKAVDREKANSASLQTAADDLKKQLDTKDTRIKSLNEAIADLKKKQSTPIKNGNEKPKPPAITTPVPEQKPEKSKPEEPKNPKTRIMAPLQLPQENSTEPKSLKTQFGEGATAELLGLPEKVGDIPLNQNVTANAISITAKGRNFARFQSADGDMTFQWFAGDKDDELHWPEIRTILKRCILKITDSKSGSLYYPLEAPETLNAFELSKSSSKNVFERPLPIGYDRLIRAKQCLLAPGKNSARISIDGSDVELTGSGSNNALVGDSKGMKLELSIDGKIVRLSSKPEGGQDPPKIVKLVHLNINRLLTDPKTSEKIEYKLAEVK